MLLPQTFFAEDNTRIGTEEFGACVGCDATPAWPLLTVVDVLLLIIAPPLGRLIEQRTGLPLGRLHDDFMYSVF